MNAVDSLTSFIAAHWEDTVRVAPADDGTLIGLPQPYTVPCRKQHFQELYYWDTFYTNEGLLAQGRVDLARGNVDNLLHLVERFGFVPNGNRTFYLTRSQPPHLALMVERVFTRTGDHAWLANALPRLVAEQQFWQQHRTTACGLASYGHQAGDQELLEEARRPDTRSERAGPPADREGRIRWAGHSYAECESGWDFSPRFERRCLDFIPADLNALLFASERILATLFSRLGRCGESELWLERASERAARMRTHLWCADTGAFLDRDLLADRHAPVLSAAVFYPVWLGVTNPAETAATLALLPRLERAHGVLACEPGERTPVGQWDAPNGWPPLQYATVQSLLAGGRDADAARVAERFVRCVAQNFERTGDLWEKYNVVTGDLVVRNEYTMPAMMGWTAGVAAALAPRF